MWACKVYIKMWAPDGLPFGNMNDGAQESRTGSGAALAGVQALEAYKARLCVSRYGSDGRVPAHGMDCRQYRF
jgi:hypothetical protein